MEAQQVLAIICAKTFSELRDVIQEYAVFEVGQVRWYADEVIHNILKAKELPIEEMNLYIIPPIPGLRCKVAELMLTDNYKQPWE